MYRVTPVLNGPLRACRHSRLLRQSPLASVGVLWAPGGRGPTVLGAVWAPPGPRCSRCSGRERDPGEVGVTSQGSKRGARECLGGCLTGPARPSTCGCPRTGCGGLQGAHLLGWARWGWVRAPLPLWLLGALLFGRLRAVMDKGRLTPEGSCFSS